MIEDCSNEYDYDTETCIVSSIREPLAPIKSIYASIGVHMYLIISRLDHLAFHRFESQTNDLQEVFRFHGPTITALESARVDNEDVLITFDKNSTIAVISAKPEAGFIKNEIMRLDPKGHQHAIDSNPIIKKCNMSGETKYLLLHCFQGYIHLLAREDTGKTKRKRAVRGRSNDHKWNISTLSIGSSVVSKLVPLKDSGVALLYRDFNFNYSLRYYLIYEDSIVLDTQFNEFEIPPSCVVPASLGGVFIFTGTRLFYFAKGGTSLALENSADDSISINSDANVITKDLSKYPQLRTEIFSSYAIIDDTRVLVLSNSGMTYLLNAQTEASSRMVILKRMDLIQLGKSTVPLEEGLFHLTDGLFVQVSKYSKTVLFQVLPTTPHIRILKSLDACSPVLDLNLTDSKDHWEIIATQGGYEGSGLIRYTNFTVNCKTLAHEDVGGSFNFTELAAVGLNRFVISNSETRRSYEYGSQIEHKGDFEIIQDAVHSHTYDGLQLTSTGISNVFEAKVDSGQILNSDLIVYVSGLSVYARTQTVSLGVLDVDSRILYSYFVKTGTRSFSFLLVTKSQTILGQFVDGFQILHSSALIESCNEVRLVVEEDCWYVIHSDGYGRLYQHKLVLAQQKLELLDSVFVSLSDTALKLLTYGNTVVASDYKRAWTLKVDAVSKLLLPIELNGVSFEQMELLSEDTLVTLEKSRLSVLQLPTEVCITSKETYNCYHLISKTVQLPVPEPEEESASSSVLSVLVCQSTKSSGPNMKKNCFLQLVDHHKMTVLDEYKFTDHVELVDLVALYDAEYAQTLVFVLSSNSPSAILVFSVNKNKLELTAQSEYECRSVTASSLALVHNDSPYFKLSVSGEFNYVVQCQRDSEAGFTWELVEESISQCPVFPVAQAVWNEDGPLYYGDVRDGVFVKDLDEVSFAQVVLQYPHNFITALAAVPAGHRCISQCLVVGDSFGNVSLIKENRQIACFNVGDQINVIKTVPARQHPAEYGKKSLTPVASDVAIIGTLNGGLFRVALCNSAKDAHTISSCAAEWDNAGGSLDWQGVATDGGIPDSREAFGAVHLAAVARALAVPPSALSSRKYKHTRANMGLLRKLHYQSVAAILQYES